jgi:flagellar motility protein MotE (MotC chaperone)
MRLSFRIIPLILIISFLAFTVRVGEVISGFRALSGSAQAEVKKEVAPKSEKSDTAPPKESDPASSDTPMDPSKKSTDPENPDQEKKESKDSKKSTDSKKSAAAWPDPTDSDPELERVREGLIKDLAIRRDIIEKQEKALLTREAMLRAGEEEIDQKFREMSELRKQLQALLNQQSEEESERLKSLVRIYEGMKPADAARIFNTLEINILLDVMTRMSERKSAPILAAMDADRARMITIMMAQQKKLPELPDLQEASKAAP